MAHMAGIVFGLDLITLILSLAVFFVFFLNVKKFTPGEGKRIFVLLTVFLGINFLSLLFFEGFEVAEFLKIIKGVSEGIEESIEIAFHILQIIGLSILFYLSVIFANFAEKLEKERE